MWVEENLPLGSGVTEAACKVIVNQRLCGSGMKWKEPGAVAVLSVRCLLPDVHDRTLVAVLEQDRPVRIPGRCMDNPAKESARPTSFRGRTRLEDVVGDAGGADHENLDQQRAL